MYNQVFANTTNNVENIVTTVTVKHFYTKSIDTSGWLKVKLDPSNKFAFLCDYTKVIIQKVENDRTYFLIKEGRYANNIASLSNKNAIKCLIDCSRGTGATLTVTNLKRKKEISIIRKQELNQLFADLSFNGNKARITIDSDVDYVETNPLSPYYRQILHSKPLPNGTYNILAPFTAGDKESTDYYRTDPNGYKALAYDTVWFPIEYAPTYNSNFVHVGNLSEGCITCYEIQKWNDLYQYLISNRSDSDGKYVGKLIIG
ncbi:hypothetical protein A9G41_01990 [Gilliamella sp. Nev5-1]|jgi:hypothetical protein|uniref:hypothetical protein n=1 Tax=Gilliamella sp. Nev5-1 TaxID=3120251 RepID=UPI000828084D|nr:hypothetical protein [Gilliamella apicola]OCG71840.1 hypothetical protein A9G41_01990 [Gilliamella apicola]